MSNGIQSKFAQDTVLVGTDGNVLPGRATLALEWDNTANAYRRAYRSAASYVAALYAANGDTEAAYDKAGLEFWRSADRIRVSGYPGIEDGELADREGFLSDPLRREHAILHGWTAIQQIKGRDSAELLPLDR